MSREVASGVNIYQAGSDPALGPDEQYPDWLWKLLDKPKTIKQLHQQAQEVGGFVEMPPRDYFRLVRLERKAQIKAHNAASAK